MVLLLALVLSAASAQDFNFNGDEIKLYEDSDLAAVLGKVPPYSYSESHSVRAYPQSYDFANSLEIDYTNIPSEEQIKEYLVGPEAICTDILLIQHSTQLLREVKNLLPWRSIMVINCEEEQSTPMSASVRFHRKRILNPVSGKDYAALLIIGSEVAPSSIININGKIIYIQPEYYSRQYIINLNQWINIQDKNFTEESGVFSMFTPHYGEIFDTYVQSLPFSQTVLLQMVPLGSTKGLGGSPITEFDRSRSSNFIDYIWCGGHLTAQRKCDGGKFKGNYSGPHVYNYSEIHTHLIQMLIGLLLGDINYDQYRKDFKSTYNARAHVIMSEYAEYEDTIGQSGYFAYIPIAAWVALKPSKLNKPDNELPHELGHTYGLPDWSGKDQFAYKHKDFQLKKDNSLVLPFTTNLKYKRSSMNGGDYADSKDGLFTALSAYDKLVIAQKMQQAADIDSRIVIDTAANYDTIVVILIKKDVLAYKINALIPAVIQDSTQSFSTTNDYVQIQAFDSTNKLVSEIKYNVHLGNHKIVALPQKFLPDNGYLDLSRPHQQVYRKLFERNDSKSLPAPRKGNRQDVFESLSEIHLETLVDFALLNNEDTFKDLCHQYDNIHVTSSQEAFISSIKIPILDNGGIGNTLTITNTASESMKLLLDGGIELILPSNKMYFLVFRNGWKEVSVSSSPTRVLVLPPIAVTEQTATLTEELYGSKYGNLKVDTVNGNWSPYFTLNSLSAGFLGKTTEFHCHSSSSFEITLVKGLNYKLVKGESKIFEYTNGWNYWLYDLSDSVGGVNLNLNANYTLSCEETANTAAADLPSMFSNSLQIFVEISDSCPKAVVDLPAMDSKYIGRELIIFKNTSTAIQVRGAETTLLSSNAHYVFAYVNPWKMIGQNYDAAVFSGSEIFINNIAELLKFEEPTYIFELLQLYDAVHISINNDCWIPTLVFSADRGYIEHLHKIVTISVQSNLDVLLDMQTNTHTMHTGDQEALHLSTVWQLTSLY